MRWRLKACLLLLGLFCAFSVAMAQTDDLPPPSDSPDVRVYEGNGGIETLDLSDITEQTIFRFWSFEKGLSSFSGPPMGEGLPSAISHVSIDGIAYYEGIFNYFDAYRPGVMSIWTPGRWRLEVLSMNYAPVLQSGVPFLGADDRVIDVSQVDVRQFRIRNEQPKQLFKVHAYGNKNRDLISTQFALDTKVETDGDIHYLLIEADGQWSIDFGAAENLPTITETMPISTASAIATPSPTSTISQTEAINQMDKKSAARPSLSSSNPPTSTPNPDAGDYRIVSLQAKITERNDVWEAHSWKVTIQNKVSHDLILDAIVEFLDSEGFVLDQDSSFGWVVRAGETKTFTGRKLITLKVSRKVKSYNVNVGTSR